MTNHIADYIHDFAGLILTAFTTVTGGIIAFVIWIFRAVASNKQAIAVLETKSDNTDLQLGHMREDIKDGFDRLHARLDQD